MSERQQTFEITISGANRSLTKDDVVSMMEEAYMVYYQDDIDYKEGAVKVTAKLLNEVYF